MSTNQKKIKLDTRPKESKQNYHWIPCDIDYTGPAEVSSFFDSIVRPDEQKPDKVIGSFRGRPLSGTKIRLPDDFCGLALTTSKLEDQACLVPSEKFKELIHWNWDQESTINDPAQEALQWLQVSEHLHQSVTKQELDKFVPEKKN